MMFNIYLCDTETSGLEVKKHEIIEISLYHLNSDRQMTWFLKPNKPETIDKDALKINHTNIDDLLHKTAEGREKYKDQKEVTAQIENWVMEDFVTPNDRIFVAQNAAFDMGHLKCLWDTHGLSGSFPFGRKVIDTIQVELLLDLVEDKQKDYYNLGGLVEYYKVKKDKAHSASGDTKMLKDVFLKQLERMKAKLK